MDELEAENTEKYWKIFMPHASVEADRIRANNSRFVHYTNAEAGLKILRSERVLLRNSTLMNDFSEVQHGLNCLLYAYNGALGDRLRQAMSLVQVDLPDIIQNNFNSQIEDFRHQTYLMSISEHGDTAKGDELEDLYGRLSMWRAYSKRNGVAFVFKNGPFVTDSNALNAFTSPVLYATPDTFLGYFEQFVFSIETNVEFIKNFGGALLHDAIMNAFRFTVQSTKHPSVHEEKEWRVIYSPTLLVKDEGLSPQQRERVPTEIMDLGGTPQRIYAIPFKNYPEDGFMGATIPELIDKILIGPSPDAYAIADAFAAELITKNVANAHERIRITGIPLRS